MNTSEILTDYYNNYDEDGRLASRYGYVEYLTTMTYTEKYLQPGMRILEVGAGTGRYSHALARKGYRVDAVELVAHNIEVFRNNTRPGENITVCQGTATDLSSFADNTYDITLVLGPMYHLFTREEQEKALAEAVRVTKPGGIVSAAYCMGDPTVLSYGFGRGKIHEIIADCKLNPDTFETFSTPWDIFQLYRKEGIDDLRSRLPVTQLHFIATDGFTHYMRETIAAMDEVTYQLFLKYHLATCERQDMVGLSHHTLDIFRKETI